ERAAGVAVAGRVQRRGILPELRTLQVQPSLTGKGCAVPAHAGRGHAVEEVNASRNALNEVFGKADTHQVARAIRRQRGVAHLEHGVHVGLGLSYREPADSVTRPVVQIANGRCGFATQVRVHAALHHGKERLVRVGANAAVRCGEPVAPKFPEGFQAPGEPSDAAFARVARGSFV